MHFQKNSLQPSRNRLTYILSVAIILSSTTSLRAQETRFIDEARFGAGMSAGSSHGNAIIPAITVFFDPLDSHSAEGLVDTILSPRIYLGGEVGHNISPSTAHLGFNWNIDLTETIFLDIGLGGLIHDGYDTVPAGKKGIALGCDVLFHEFASLGYRVNENWNVSTQVEHASHAGLCDGPNQGLTRINLMVGYKF